MSAIVKAQGDCAQVNLCRNAVLKGPGQAALILLLTVGLLWVGLERAQASADRKIVVVQSLRDKELHIGAFRDSEMLISAQHGDQLATNGGKGEKRKKGDPILGAPGSEPIKHGALLAAFLGLCLGLLFWLVVDRKYR